MYKAKDLLKYILALLPITLVVSSLMVLSSCTYNKDNLKYSQLGGVTVQSGITEDEYYHFLEFGGATLLVCILIIWWSNTKSARTKNESKYYDYNYRISPTVKGLIGVIAILIAVLDIMFLWVVYCVNICADFTFILFFPIIVGYIILFFHLRSQIVTTDSDYKGTDQDHPSIHDSYVVQRKGKKSWNPIILVLDFIFQRYPSYTCTLFYPLHFWGSIFCAIISFIVVNDGFWEGTYIIFYFLAFFFVCCFLRLDKLYRKIRHRYLKKHDLPGPYGWGTIDYHRSDTYTKEWDIHEFI